VVFAHQAFEQCRRDWPELSRISYPDVPPWSTAKAEKIEECVLISHNWDQIRRLMWNYVGIVRSVKRLTMVKQRLDLIVSDVRQHFHDFLLTPDLIELRNIALIAQLIVQSALLRQESRGLHYVIDFPEKDDLNWKKNTVLQIGKP
jgi:L-aspartate oxidase